MEKKTNYLVDDKIFATKEEADRYAKILSLIMNKTVAVVPTKRRVTHALSLEGKK